LSRLYTAHSKKSDWNTGVDIEVCLMPTVEGT